MIGLRLFTMLTRRGLPMKCWPLLVYWASARAHLLWLLSGVLSADNYLTHWRRLFSHLSAILWSQLSINLCNRNQVEPIIEHHASGLNEFLINSSFRIRRSSMLENSHFSATQYSQQQTIIIIAHDVFILIFLTLKSFCSFPGISFLIVIKKETRIVGFCGFQWIINFVVETHEFYYESNDEKKNHL